MNTAENVMVGITGAAYVGPTTATAPTASDSTLTGFSALGYISADGVTFTSDKSTSQIRAWQNSDLVREVITDTTVTYTFSAIESNQDVIELYFGATMVNGKIEYSPNQTGGRKSFVFDVVDGTKVVRHYVPSGEITAVEPQTFVNGDAVGYGFTVTAYATSDRTADVFYGEFEVA